MESSFILTLCLVIYLWWRGARTKEQVPLEAPKKVRSSGRKFYWIIKEDGGKADMSIWTARDST